MTEYKGYPKPDPFIDEFNEVNRLIIVGNGFDLAHGLKSRFGDFISSYLFTILTEFKHKLNYSDELIEINPGYAGGLSKYIRDSIVPEDGLASLSRISDNNDVTVNWKSRFFQDLVSEFASKNWVDVEVAYFDNLKRGIKTKSPVGIKNLNADFEVIRKKFLEYLSNKLETFNSEIKPELIEQFTSEITTEEVAINTVRTNREPISLYFLNFNYTNILSTYLESIPEFSNYVTGRLTINYIHGQLKSHLEEPIFGFGDEIDKGYTDLEDGRDDNVFRHIKSFMYLKNSNYRNLMKFINSSPYQVHIYGHSCGVSDRTMLKTIFEHINCISVKAYYHARADGSNDYTDKNYSIARHFSNKAMLRDKVVNLEYCTPMYQPI